MKKLLALIIAFMAAGAASYPTYAVIIPEQTPYKIYIPINDDNTANVHSNYKNNTDTCASCHQTHSAQGAALLQWQSVSETCMACHDGTVTTTYDVVAGRFLDKEKHEYYPTSGGLFSSDGEDKNVSMHNVSEMVSVSAAPGSSGYSERETTTMDTPFSCASCHNPHGAGGNARLLQQDVNGVAQRYPLQKAQMFALDEKGARRLWSVYPDIDGDGNRDKEWQGRRVRAYSLITIYPYSRDIKVFRRPRNNSLAPYELITGYSIDNSSGATVLKFNTDPSKKKDKINYYNIYVDAYPGLTVGVRIKNYMKLGENIEYKYGINAFCAACHEDYNTATREFFKHTESANGYASPYLDQFSYYSGSGGKKWAAKSVTAAGGIYSEAYRHQVGMIWETNTKGLKFERDPWNPDESILDKTKGRFVVNCLTCHLAHGVSKEYWEKTVGERPDGLDEDIYLPLGIFTYSELHEMEPPSALKRMPNMAVCEACHKKGEDAIQFTVNEEKD